MYTMNIQAEHIRSEQELLALQKQYEILPKSGDKDEIGEEDDGTEDEMPSPIKKEHLASQAQLNDQILVSIFKIMNFKTGYLF